MRKRNSKVSFWPVLFCFFFFSFSTGYAQEPVFAASVSGNRVVQNTVFEIRFELQNAAGDDFLPPDFKNFKVVGGPSMGSSTTIINSKVTRSQSWTYSLLATQPGSFTIGSASIVAGRKKLSTRPVNVAVLAAEDMARSGSVMPGDVPVKLVAYVKPGNYYPGQQIVLEYKIYFSENIQAANTISEDDYSDFFVQNFNSFSKEASYETINGVSYAARIVKGVALFAHQSGTYTIDPMVLSIGINAPFPGNQGFFTMRRLHNIQVASEPLTLRILPLPADRVDSGFSGAVGRYEMSLESATATEITTDDDFRMRIEIRGNGDSRRWDPPRITARDGLEIYDARIVKENVMDSEGMVSHSRSIEYTLLPVEPGEYTVYVPFRYFNPETERYETINSDTFFLRVSKGVNSKRSIASDSLTDVSLRKVRKVSNITTDDRFWLSIPHLILFGMILSCTCVGAWITYKRKQQESLSPIERLRSESSIKARHQLDLLNKDLNVMSDQDFYETITEIYYKFLSARFGILPSDLDMDKLVTYFNQSNIQTDIKDRALNFFNQSLSVRYGGIPPGFPREEMLAECSDIINELDLSADHI